ncbi:hypothetical protein TNIN_107931 [Trichonephila inaurata madagascariensis]|uniref:Uncharacterized protein n=1 Tax=Trichonephila inaurata madagascariensis TaxID=2747483 RepID=A0A8X7CNX1_9ARAC|nr:hypothetical protein TNIN_107931 [Trichonephila inaurata madagascariensis]
MKEARNKTAVMDSIFIDFRNEWAVPFNDGDDHDVHDGDHGDDPHDGRDDGRDDGGDHDARDGHDDGGDRDVHDGRGGGHGDHDDDALHQQAFLRHIGEQSSERRGIRLK